MENATLIQKYNVPAPRYTSYPPVPQWEQMPDSTEWKILLRQAYAEFGEEEGIHLYIHLPYCESLCTYCGCTKRITKNHQVEEPYVYSLLKEWEEHLAALPPKPLISGIHLGGGTPTFFSPEHLELLLSELLDSGTLAPDAALSFEGHPNNTTREHLQRLYDLGFRRVSFGVQDVDPKVQRAIHRIQPFEKVVEVTEAAREIGYTSINFDLIYGLPHQTPQSIRQTFSEVASLRPERIAFYSYAHLPQAFPAQKSFEAFLPQNAAKRALYSLGRELLTQLGYQEIGMDHFALPEDPLCQAKEQARLHRNFMGYTVKPSRILLGLGSSAISDIHYAYVQNEKEVDTYKALLRLDRSAHVKGHVMHSEDIETRRLLLALTCNGRAEWNRCFFKGLSTEAKNQLETFRAEGLLHFSELGIRIRPAGMAYLRNICMVFDRRLHEDSTAQRRYSQSI